MCCILFTPLKSTAEDDGSSVTPPPTDWRIWSTEYRALGETEKDAFQTKTITFSGLGRIISTGDCRSPQGRRVASECSQVTLRWQHDELRVQVTGPSTPSTEWPQSGRVYGIKNCLFKASQDWGLGVVTSCEASNFGDVLVPESIPEARKSAVTTHRKHRRKTPRQQCLTGPNSAHTDASRARHRPVSHDTLRTRTQRFRKGHKRSCRHFDRSNLRR